MKELQQRWKLKKLGWIIDPWPLSALTVLLVLYELCVYTHMSLENFGGSIVWLLPLVAGLTYLF